MTEQTVWVLIPREPTEEMVLAALKARQTTWDSGKDACATYAAMLAAAPSPQAGSELVKRLCGDPVNGGDLRDLAFTVWQMCHNPTHEDGNTDWGNDTLPVVNLMVERWRTAITSLEQTNRELREDWAKFCAAIGCDVDTHEAVAAKILSGTARETAHTEAREVAIKPLEWSDDDLLKRAHSILGTYRVWTHHEANGRWFWEFSTPGGFIITKGNCDTEADATAFVEDHYDGRIRSALLPSPTAEENGK